jgi:hypothetical protein
MPTKRRRMPHNQAAQISPAILSLVSEGLWQGEEAESEVAEWKFFLDDDEKKQIFDQVRDVILGEWIRRRPGTRPNWWWETDAPEKSRRRLGGIGDAAHEFLNYVERYDHGIPRMFLDQRTVDLYNGRLRDIHGNPVMGEYTEGYFKGRAIDPTDPPVFESEAAFLKRHGLLTARELSTLRKADFEPEIVLIERHSN